MALTYFLEALLVSALGLRALLSGLHIIAVFVLLRLAVLCCVQVCEAEKGWVGGGETGFERVGAAVEDFIYSVDDVVDEGLWDQC